jgi:hypothetical protein
MVNQHMMNSIIITLHYITLLYITLYYTNIFALNFLAFNEFTKCVDIYVFVDCVLKTMKFILHSILVILNVFLTFFRSFRLSCLQSKKD